MGQVYREKKGNVTAIRGRIQRPVGQDPVYNFLPIVTCPYCGRTKRAAISGWGGKVSSRLQFCKYCGNEFTIEITTKSIKHTGKEVMPK